MDVWATKKGGECFYYGSSWSTERASLRVFERNIERRHRQAPEDTLEQIGPFLHPIPMSSQPVFFVRLNGHFSSLGAFIKLY